MVSFEGSIEPKIGSTKFDLEKMRAPLVQHRFLMALKGFNALSDTLSEEQKVEILDKAYSSIILPHGDKPLREVARNGMCGDIRVVVHDKFFG